MGQLNSGVVRGAPKTTKPGRTGSTSSLQEGRRVRTPRLGRNTSKPLTNDGKRKSQLIPNSTRWPNTGRSGTGNDGSLFDWKAYDKKFWEQYWLKFSGVANVTSRMPLHQGTRMLRARRKDINVKPNRRLDRKSSKGMLFENEELRMRTIAINSEVEQGQHALKKLRRENELLRREVWSLRDEYSKMENLLQNKGESDGEESDQENSYSEEESDELDEEEALDEEEKQESSTIGEENQNSHQKLQVPRRSSRVFDGLSVIDELTEETQTTDGHVSRGSSVKTDKDGLRRVEGYLDPYQRFDCLEASEWGMFRPSSPYPYAKATPIPTYDHRLKNIQEPNIPERNPPWLTAGTSTMPYQRADMQQWMCPSVEMAHHSHQCPSDDINAPPPLRVSEDASETSEWSLPPPPPEDNSITVEERQGPDVFITDTYPYFPPPPDDLIAITSEMNKIEISQKAEISPKYTAATRGPSAIVSDESAAICATLGAQSSYADAGGAKPERPLVGCQFASTEDSRQNVVPTENEQMRRNSNEKGKPFQSKLTLTLRFPDKNSRASPARQTTSQSSSVKCGKTGVAGGGPPKNELPRLQTHHVNSRTPAVQAGSAPGTVSSGPLCRLPASTDIPLQQTCSSTSLPPVLGTSTSLDGLTPITKPSTLPGAPTEHLKGKTPPAPPPRTSSCPSVASSSSAVPTPTVGVTAQHHRAFRKGISGSLSSHQESDKEAPQENPPIHHTNPLLLGDPVATSSPTLPHKLGSQKSTDSHRPRLRKQSSVKSTTQEETTDEGIVSGSSGLVRKSSKSSKAEADRLTSRKLRKQSQVSLTSLDPRFDATLNPSLNPLEKARLIGLNNISISSSSGLDSPTKSERRKRRVSIKFNKRPSTTDEERPGILTNFRSKNRCEETDGTISDRERTNSISSRTSSVTRRKLSSSSSRTVFHEEKIPWCGCWGNGCV